MSNDWPGSIAHPADCACGTPRGHRRLHRLIVAGDRRHLGRGRATAPRGARGPNPAPDAADRRPAESVDRPSGRRDDATRATRDPNQILLGANEVVVAETLRAAGQPLTRGEVEARSGLTFAQVRRSLGHLRDAGRVAMSGWGGGTGRGNYARWRLCDPTPAPTPSPSANAGKPSESWALWNGRGTATARQPGLVVRPERLDPLVQLLQPLQRLLEGLHGQAAVFSGGGPAASGASPQLGEVGHLGTFLMATARAKASSIPLMGPK